MIKTFRYRLYPTRRQATRLHEQIDEACRLYNACLEHRVFMYSRYGVRVSEYDQTAELKTMRADGTLDIISFKPAQDVIKRVQRAFEAFFRRVKQREKPGKLRFKSRRRYHSITYINYGKTPQTDKKGKLILQGIGHLKVKWHRPIAGTTRTLTIKREADRWYAMFSVEHEPQRLEPTAHSTGVDVGIESFAMLSDGTAIANPHYTLQAQKRVRRAQRRLERRTIRDRKGRVHGRQSTRRRKALLMLQRAWIHVRQQRRHFHHVEARTLVNTFQVIGMEALQIRNLTRSAKGTREKPGTRVRVKAGLNRAILDAGWGQFQTILLDKAAEAGRWGCQVTAAHTSQICPCGAPVPKTLADRWHHCAVCGLSVPRDQASAMVIEQRALAQLSA
jgi:putative transposase